jgi:hypothetical protein
MMHPTHFQDHPALPREQVGETIIPGDSYDDVPAERTYTGGRVAQNRPAGADLFRSLNGAYGGLRARQDAVATDSAAQEFRELLEVVSGKFPELTAKCADLQSRLDEILRQLA